MRQPVQPLPVAPQGSDGLAVAVLDEAPDLLVSLRLEAAPDCTRNGPSEITGGLRCASLFVEPTSGCHRQSLDHDALGLELVADGVCLGEPPHRSQLTASAQGSLHGTKGQAGSARPRSSCGLTTIDPVCDGVKRI